MFHSVFSQKKTFTAERVEQLKQLSGTPDIYERLAKALGKRCHCIACDCHVIVRVHVAPSIYENDDIKKGILLQMFGGTKKDFKDTGRGRFR